MKQHLLFLPAVLAVAAASLAIACGGDNKTSTSSGTTNVAGTPQTGATAPSSGSNIAIPEKKIVAKDYSYDFPDSFNGGLVRLTMTNNGKQPHQAQVVRVNNGVTSQQFQDALKGPDEGALLKLVTLLGGPNTIDPGATQSVVNNLPAGDYALLCFVSDEDGVSHIAKGMVKRFTVKTPSDKQPSRPDSNENVTLMDFSFTGADSYTPGKHTLVVANNGPQAHELAIIKLKPDVTVDQLKQLIANEVGPLPPGSPPAPPADNAAPPPPAPPAGAPSPPEDPIADAGGLGAIDKGLTGWVDVDLQAGNYAFICFLPDSNTGLPDAALGMVKGFAVK